MSEILRKGVKKRPSWDYTVIPERQTHEYSTMEMTESVRNTLEQIRDSQMLQCDVATAIKKMLTEIRGLRRDLKRKRKKG